MPTLPTLLTIADAGISPVFLASATGGLLTVTVILTPHPNPNPNPKPQPAGLLFIFLIVGTVVTNFGVMKK